MIAVMTIEPTELRTERLLLRPFRMEDAEDLFAVYSDEETASFALPGAVTRASMEQSLARHLHIPWYDRPNFAVVFGGKVVGEIVLDIDHANLIANLGYAIAREHWGKGLATEAARA